MATKWMRAALASSSVLLRTSRSGLARSRHVQLPSFRWASAVASQPKEERPMLDDTRSTKQTGNDTSAITDQLPLFSTLEGKISPHLLRAITVEPFRLTSMSSVQAQVLPLLPGLATPYDSEKPPEERTDLLVKAKTGTGKTLGFLIPAVESRLQEIAKYGKQAVIDAGLVTDKALELRARKIFTRTHAGCLIISPTRELATQIANEALRLTKHLDDFQVRLFVGGVSKRMQMKDWMKGRRDIVVATPGRIRDMLETEPEVKKGLEKCPLLILDEADTLLEMGFREEIAAISEFLPQHPDRQTFMFSATVSREIQQIARQVLAKKYQFINCVSEDDSPVHAHVPQYHTVLPSAGHQLPHILRLIAHDQLANPGKSKIMLFLPTTKMTQLFSTFIRQLRTLFPAKKATHVYEIHSKRTQDARTRTSDEFRADKSGASILVSSDVSARGIDYPGVTRVIQLGIPGGTEQYIHRVGRTGRGKDRYGRADLVLLPWEVGFVTWQLTDIPLKLLTVNELDTQVKTLAEEHDADPKAFFNKISAAPRGRVTFDAPYAPILSEFEREIRGLTEQLDEEAIKETLASLLGYYFGKYHEIRVQKPVVLEGLKDWTVETCGLSAPPHISTGFLQRLGLDDNRTNRFGQAARHTSRRPVESNRWAGRGHVKTRWQREEEGDEPRRTRFLDMDRNDPSGSPEEYRSGRYRR